MLLFYFTAFLNQSLDHSVNRSLKVMESKNASVTYNNATNFDIEDEFCQSGNNSTLVDNTELKNIVKDIIEDKSDESVSVSDSSDNPSDQTNPKEDKNEEDSAISSPSGDLSSSKQDRPSSEEETEESEHENSANSYPEKRKLWPNTNIMMDFDESELPSTCSVLETENGGFLYLVGTAHFSKESNADVARTIQVVRPNSVLLELCQGRTNILLLDEKTVLRECQNWNLGQISSIIKVSAKNFKS